MHDGRFMCFARREIWNDSVAVFVGYKREDGSIDALAPPALQRLAPHAVAEPCLQLRLEDAQQLMDELWSAGLRPSNGTGSAGAMAAVQAHLFDLQRLVFKGEPVENRGPYPRSPQRETP